MPVEAGQKSSASMGEQSLNLEVLIEACVEEVLKILEREKER